MSILVLLVLAACSKNALPPNTASELPAGSDADHTLTILVSQGEKTAYCDGEKMDSEGYRKTITTEKTVPISGKYETASDKAKAIAIASTSGTCQDAIKALDIKVQGGVVHIPPIDGWAGISIAMCTCKPELEVNLRRTPGIANVVWDETR